MSGITEEGLLGLLDEMRRSSEPEAYRKYLREAARRIVPPTSDLDEHVVACSPRSELQAAKRLLEKHGFTVVPNSRIATVDVGHRLSELEVYRMDDRAREGLVRSIQRSLSAQLGVEIVKRGAATEALIRETLPVPALLIGYHALVILPEKSGG
jgi:hypothetical protein